MKIVSTIEPIIIGARKAVFLAGPTYRINHETMTHGMDGPDVPRSWRKDAIKLFEETGFDGVLYVPEWVNNEKPEGWTYSGQVQWEVDAMNASDYILFWIPRDMRKLPALTTNIEFGEWLHSERIIVGAPDNAEKMEYIKSRCDKENIPFHNKLQDCVYTINSALDEKVAHKSNVWFTSDTHFSQERTLNLSKRPFKSVEQMDRDMIRKWNYKVREEDVVYHLGDFGDTGTAYRTVSQLNGAHIFIVPGNYDTPEFLSELKRDPRVTVLDQGHIVTIEGVRMRMVYMPEAFSGDTFHLYGHVHQLQMVKTNALNVGVDCHDFYPIDKETIMFYHTAITKHYDKNVFNDFREDIMDQDPVVIKLRNSNLNRNQGFALGSS